MANNVPRKQTSADVRLQAQRKKKIKSKRKDVSPKRAVLPEIGKLPLKPEGSELFNVESKSEVPKPPKRLVRKQAKKNDQTLEVSTKSTAPTALLV